MTRRPIVLSALIVMGLLIAPTSARALEDSADTATWNMALPGKVFATAQYGNVMFVGGRFGRVQADPSGSGGPGYAASNLAAIDMTTGQGIASFAPAVTGNVNQTAEVHSLAVVGNTLYVGGQFAAVDGQPRYNLAAITLDPASTTGTVDPAFDATVGVPGAANERSTFVYEILPGAAGVYVGGTFTKVDGIARSKTALVRLDGSLDSAFKTTRVNGSVRDMEFAADGQTVFVGGAFNVFNGTPRRSIARISPVTGALEPWAIPTSQIEEDQTAWDLVVTATRVYGGLGRGPNYAAAYRVGSPLFDGSRVWRFSTSGNVQSIALLGGTDLVIGGHFGTFLEQRVCNNQLLKNLGILRGVAGETSPQLDCSFLPQFSGPNKFGGVWEIQVTASALWTGGEFTKVGDVGHRGIARFTL
ncbi:hypothetical protein BH18ACT17_BH18ACT17_11380 [soil metagenome]